MKYVGIPNNLTYDDECIIDMSDLNFNSDIDNKRAALIFLRNTDLRLPITFNNCKYNDKEEYLLKYYFDNISVKIDILDKTWINILSNCYLNTNVIYPDSILSINEINTFIDRNKNELNDIYRFIISLPLCSIMYYKTKSKNNSIDVSIYEVVDYDKLNMDNFINIIDYPEIVYIINSNNDMKPVLYSKYFKKNKHVHELIYKLPFLNIINLLMYGSDGPMDMFIDSIDKMLSEKGE